MLFSIFLFLEGIPNRESNCVLSYALKPPNLSAPLRRDYRHLSRALAFSYAPVLIFVLVSGPLIASWIANPSLLSPNGLSSTCHFSFNYGHSFPISVLVISAGSTGRICVSYLNAFNNSISGPAYISVFQYNSTGRYGVCPGCIFDDVTSLFKPTSLPSTVTFSRSSDPGDQREIVTYAIPVPPDLNSGIFGIYVTQFCSLFPMVVIPSGEAHVELTSSDFSSWYPHEGSCPKQVVNKRLLGVDGFRVVSLWLGFAWT